MITMIDLGWCMARLNTKNNSLVIVSGAAIEEDVYLPATSLSIYRKCDLIALRDALNEAYPPI